jgi:hypothetical protein
MKKTFVYTQFQKEGYHAFPEAATDPAFKTGDYLDVSHLGTRHFHYFYFKVWVEVNHLNRDIEFIQLRRWIEKQYSDSVLELNSMSCEMLADQLIDVLAARYPESEIRVDVSEENINGAYSEYIPSRAGAVMD